VGKILNLIVLGLMAAAVMMVAQFLLMKLGLPNYPGIELYGSRGLKLLCKDLASGAGFALIFGFLVRPILPSGKLMAALIFSIVPFIFFVMVWPMWRGRPIVTDTWYLIYQELDVFILSLVLVLLGKSGGSKEK
jgi:hypothetical protein